MKLHVFFSPADLTAIGPDEHAVYIVIDIIRATTSLITMFDRGAKRAFIADTVEQAREAVQLYPNRLLCGERNVQPLPGFDYGNSPAHFLQADLIGRELILTTTNGTRAFFACPFNSLRLAGCFYNAYAVTAYALAQARQRNCNIGIVCAGEHNYFALDDACCAGYLAQELLQQDATLDCHESVLAAQALFQIYPPQTLLKTTNSARQVIAGGLGIDLEICAHINGSSSVAQVIGQESTTNLLILEKV